MLRTLETDCNHCSLISLWEVSYSCAGGSSGTELIKKDLPVVCSVFSETCLNMGPFIHVPLSCSVGWGFLVVPF